MNIRRLYAILVSLLALLVSFYAVMTLAFAFGERTTEWQFPLFITIVAALIVWTAITLWRGKEAFWLTAASTLLVTGILGWIIIPSGSRDGAYFLLALAFLVAAGSLLALLTKSVRTALHA
jgi:hypothetical protein